MLNIHVRDPDAIIRKHNWLKRMILRLNQLGPSGTVFIPENFLDYDFQKMYKKMIEFWEESKKRKNK